jgi:hypothetical protein
VGISGEASPCLQLGSENSCCPARSLSHIFRGDSSLYLGFLTLIAIWLGLLQFFLLKWGQAPDPQFLVRGGAGAAGLCGLWILVLVPTERLRLFNGLRIGASAATAIGTILALLFLSGKSLYGWNFGPRQNPRSVYLLGAPFVMALVRLWAVWRPRPLEPSP